MKWKGENDYQHENANVNNSAMVLSVVVRPIGDFYYGIFFICVHARDRFQRKVFVLLAVCWVFVYMQFLLFRLLLAVFKTPKKNTQ